MDMDLKVIEGDLLDSPEQYIAHQCNCLTQRSTGLAKKIFDKFPYANIYKDRTKPDIMKEIVICGNGDDKRYVINMLSQYYPGVTKYPQSNLDGTEVRKKAFKVCLQKISQIANLQSIAFPYKIGCNLAGGKWEVYRKMIKQFAEENTNVSVRIYKL